MATRLSHRRWLLRDIPRLGALSAWVLVGLAILACAFNWPPLPRISVAALLHPATASKPAAEAGNAQSIYTGSIVFVPPRGELCGQWIFDNRNGALWDNGQVSCRPTSAASRPDEVTTTARMMAISKAFKGD